jgi:Tol biopolymer transport system component
LVDRMGKSRPLPLPPQFYSHPRFSPDGKQLAYATDDGRDAIIWIYDLKGDSPPRRLTFTGRNLYPIWSSDSRFITFQSSSGGDRGIYHQRADGTGSAERLTTADQSSPHIPDSWSPDGRTLSFSITGTGAMSRVIMTVSLDGDKKPKALLTAPPGLAQGNSEFSPDGRWFAYNSNEPDGRVFHVFVQSFPPGAKYELPEGNVGPVWTRDGKQLLYNTGVLGNNRPLSVDVRTTPNFTFGRPVSVTIQGLLPSSPNSREYDISPDGKQLIAVLDSAAPITGVQPSPQINVVLNWFKELNQRVPVR